MRRVLVAIALAALVASPMGVRASVTACENPCTVQASINAYISPVVDVRSGNAVQWEGLDADVSHPTGEMGQTTCFLFPASVHRAPVPITFTIEGDGLTATQPEIGPGPYPVGTHPCESARALSDGSFVLQYQCFVHPWMNGVIRVEP